jgi:ribosome-binding protein aMBF1 (putative translation factor)
MKHIFDGKNFGKRVKMQRVINDGVDMRELSKQLKLSPATISRCENGKMPDLLTYATFCKYIGASLNEFVFLKAKGGKK